MLACVDKTCTNFRHVLPFTVRGCPVCGGQVALAPGSVIQRPHDNYTILDVLGIGGMGKVYTALTAGSGSIEVVKELYFDDQATQPEKDEAKRRFLREAETLASLTSKYFPQGYGHFDDQNREFMAMEYFVGDDLEKVLAQQPNGKLDENEVLRIGIELCEALTVLHTHVNPVSGRVEPIIHRDIKPGNIILRPNGDIGLIDLGIARMERQSQGTRGRQGTSAGTDAYMPFEQMTGNPTIRSDIYAVGATLFHLVTGQSFQNDVFNRLVEIDALPLPWQAIFRHAIADQEGNRHRSAIELRDDLVQLLPLPLRPPQPVPIVPPPVPAPTALPHYTIRWKPSKSHMHGPGEYRRPVAGQVLLGGNGMPRLSIIPFITDIGGTGTGVGNTGTTVTTGPHGDFSLAIADINVPATVSRREIEVVVEDPNTGQELHRTMTRIKRPWAWRRAGVRAGAAAQSGRQRAASWFQALGRGIGAGARGIGRGVAWPFRAIGQGARAIGNNISAALTHASVANLFLLAAIGLFVAMLAGIALYWTWVWTLCPWLMFLCWRASSLARRGKLPAAWRWAVFPRLTALYVGSWLIILIAHIFGQ